MVEKIRTKIRALIEDLPQAGFDTFTYTNYATFTLSEENILLLIKVTLNGTELGTGDYTYDSETNKLTITGTGLSSGAIIIVDYTYTKYSDTELNEFIRASLVWISISAYMETDYELDDDSEISPTPDNKTTDLIALIASILIKPDYTSYKLSTVTVVYNGRIPKEEKIQKLINRFSYGIGIMGVLEI